MPPLGTELAECTPGRHATDWTRDIWKSIIPHGDDHQLVQCTMQANTRGHHVCPFGRLLHAKMRRRPKFQNTTVCINGIVMSLSLPAGRVFQLYAFVRGMESCGGGGWEMGVVLLVHPELMKEGWMERIGSHHPAHLSSGAGGEKKALEAATWPTGGCRSATPLCCPSYQVRYRVWMLHCGVTQ